MKSKRYSKNTPNKGFNFNPTNFYEDWDHDGIMNGLDCFPLDKKRQAISHMISAAPSVQARIIPQTQTAQLVSAIKPQYTPSPVVTKMYTPPTVSLAKSSTPTQKTVEIPKNVNINSVPIKSSQASNYITKPSPNFSLLAVKPQPTQSSNQMIITNQSGIITQSNNPNYKPGQSINEVKGYIQMAPSMAKRVIESQQQKSLQIKSTNKTKRREQELKTNPPEFKSTVKVPEGAGSRAVIMPMPKVPPIKGKRFNDPNNPWYTKEKYGQNPVTLPNPNAPKVGEPKLPNPPRVIFPIRPTPAPMPVPKPIVDPGFSPRSPFPINSKKQIR